MRGLSVTGTLTSYGDIDLGGNLIMDRDNSILLGNTLLTGELIDYLSLYTGETGPQGIQGATGAKGADGVQGEQGIVGNEGPQGILGGKGPSGDPGGPTGATGEQGIPGDTGDQGIRGNTGDQGVQGIPGPYGPAGMNILTSIPDDFYTNPPTHETVSYGQAYYGYEPIGGTYNIYMFIQKPGGLVGGNWFRTDMVTL
jgi:hypothetical protein